MSHRQSIETFIDHLARKIAVLYPNNCADEEDYIQAGHLKLAEIHDGEYEERDCHAYAIIAIARAMRDTALKAMCAASAPHRIKKLVHTIELLISDRKTEQEICQELRIDAITFSSLRSLIHSESWHSLFCEPTRDSEPFSFINDLLLSCKLTDQERAFLQAQFDNDVDSLGLTRKQRWLQARNLRPKLVKCGYGI